MTTVILHGALGRMGQAVRDALEKTPDMKLLAAIDAAAPAGGGASLPASGFDCPVFCSPGDCSVPADVVIDFSHHSAVIPLLDWCVCHSLPVVVCTTALGPAEETSLEKASKEIPVFRSANMSVGINLLAKLMETAVPPLEADFNIEIVEKHHNQKKDSPSGTALLLADAVNEACAVKKDYLFGRCGKSDQCKISDLGIHAVRGGTIPGEHTLIFAGPDEVIEMTHTALSRNIFAKGAVRAARWLAGRGPGLYSMKEML